MSQDEAEDAEDGREDGAFPSALGGERLEQLERARAEGQLPLEHARQAAAPR